MKNHNLDFALLGDKIKEILYEYVKIESFTNSPDLKTPILITVEEKFHISKNILTIGVFIL